MYDEREDYELGSFDWEQIWAGSGEAQQVGSQVLYSWAISPEGYGSLECCGIVQTTDGYFWAFDAWTDTTGWGCQDGVDWYGPRATVEGASGLLSQEHRRNLGFEARVVPNGLYRD